MAVHYVGNANGKGNDMTMQASAQADQGGLQIPDDNLSANEAPYTIARRTAEVHDWNHAETAAALVKEMRADAMWIEIALAKAASAIAAEVIAAERSRIWNAPMRTVAAPQNGQRLMAVAESRLMDFPLLGRCYLRHAGRAELLEAADVYSKQAKDMAVKAAWFSAIASRLGDDQIVEDALTEDDLKSLQEQANAS